MPRITLMAEDVEETVSRPVALKVIRDVLNITRISPCSKIFFPGSAEVTFQHGSTMDEQNEQMEVNQFNSDRLFSIEVDEDYDEERALTTAVMYPENRFMMVDNDLGVYIKPVYSATDVHVTFRFRAKDRVEALRWRDEIRTRTGMNRSELVHSATYNYLIPKSGLFILKEIHRLRENVMGYGESFEQYKKDKFAEGYSVVANQNGAMTREVMAETQYRIIGWFDFNANPEKGAREGNLDTWLISFTYHFKYDRPINAVMAYPLVIHNQLLGPLYRPNDRSDRDSDHKKTFTSSSGAFYRFEKMTEMIKYQRREGIYVPIYDDWIPSQIPSNTLRLYSALVTIDTENPEILTNLNHLGEGWKLEDDIAEFLKGEAPFVDKPYFSVFQLNLYRNQYLLAPRDRYVTLDADLNVRLMKPVSLRDFFHIRLSLVTRLSLLTPEAKDRLRKNACVLTKILKALDPYFDGAKYFKRLKTCGLVGRDELQNAINDIDRGIIGQGNQQAGYRFNTVSGFFVQAERTSEAK